MLSAFGRVLKTADLRRKLLFTLGMIVIYRMGTFIPAPGISYGTVQQCIANNGSNHGIYDIVNLFSGGALLQLSIFALGVMPYITASIIIQLLRVVIPRFQELHDEGAQGQAKLTQYTRYLTIALALLNGTTIVSMARSGALIGNCPNIIPVDDIWHVLLIIITLCAGTTVIMWMGEQITERGVGNGMSLLIFTSIASSFPNALGAIERQLGRVRCGPCGDARRGLRGTVGTPCARAVRKTDDWAPHHWRHQHLYSAQGQYGRCDSADFRFLPAEPARHYRPAEHPQ